MNTTHEDIELWKASMGKDQHAFGQLFRKYYSLLYQYGNKICEDTSVLEDAIQELFIEIWNRKAEPPDSVKAYLLKALKFKLYKSFRQLKFSTAVEESDKSFFELSYESFIINRENDEQKSRNIIAALSTLSAHQKEVIYLKIYKGFSYDEVSAIMAVNYQVVRNLLCQALKALRKFMQPFIIVGLGLLHY